MTRLRAAFAFTAAVLRTLLRDPQALFFMLVLPMVVIIVIGTTFGGQGTIELGVVADPDSVVGTRVLAALDGADGIEVERFTTRETVAEDTLARRATSSSVGAGRRVGAGKSSVFAAFTSENTLLPRRAPLARASPSVSLRHARNVDRTGEVAGSSPPTSYPEGPCSPAFLPVS